MTPESTVPTLTPTRSGAGWRLPALAVGVAVVGLVLLSRLGGSEGPIPPAPTTVAVVAPATPRATPQPTQPSLVVGRLAGVMRRAPDGLTYADGIPTGISGQAVYRVRDALLVPVGRTLLVGGWYLHRTDVARECAALLDDPCASATFSDVPLSGPGVGDVTTDFVAIDSRLGRTGAYILLATVETDPRCSIYAAGACLPRLRVLQPIWSGLG